MKVKNMAFQIRDAYWHSKARLLINWLLSRLGILGKEITEELWGGMKVVVFCLPVTCLLAVFAAFIWWMKHGT